VYLIVEAKEKKGGMFRSDDAGDVEKSDGGSTDSADLGT